MRKDVRLAFVIGGILIAVLVVYVLVVPGGQKPGDQQAVNLETDPAKSEPGKSEPAPPTPESTPPVVADAGKPTETTSADASPSTRPTDPFASKGTEEDKWMLALTQGSVPMMTSAPPPTASPLSPVNTLKPTETAKTTAEPVRTQPMTPVSTPPTPTSVTEAAPPPSPTYLVPVPATQPAGARTHVVRAGESIAKISEAAYGSQAYWPHIIRANPGIVAEKIRPGMTINLPPESEVKGGATLASNTQTPDIKPDTAGSRIDPNTQYEVQPNDSLNKIALKLYGNANRWQAIYEVNKEAIGADPAKLKVRSVLKLPEPPTTQRQ